MSRLEIDRQARTISGRAIPWNVVSTISRMRIGLRPHCLSWPDRVHLVLRHDNSLIAGKAIHLESAADGLYATFWINRGDRGERAFVLAEMGWGLSCRFDLLDFDEVDEVWCNRGEITEISLVPKPAFP